VSTADLPRAVVRYERRRRPKLVGVRLTRDEMTLLALVAARDGKTVASMTATYTATTQ
jgi:hypothetical protein